MLLQLDTHIPSHLTWTYHGGPHELEYCLMLSSWLSVLLCRLPRFCRVGTCITWAACATGCSRAAQTISPAQFAECHCLSRKQHSVVSITFQFLLCMHHLPAGYSASNTIIEQARMPCCVAEHFVATALRYVAHDKLCSLASFTLYHAH